MNDPEKVYENKLKTANGHVLSYFKNLSQIVSQVLVLVDKFK